MAASQSHLDFKPKLPSRFALTPFPTELPPAIDLSCRLDHDLHLLSARFSLTGDLSCLIVPAPSVSPRRRDNLWQQTCFEIFCSAANQAGYWEINLSPAGDWNCYHFNDYRQGMKEEPNLTDLSPITHRLEDRFEFTFAFELAPLGLAGSPLVIGLAAVLRDRTGGVFHWALAHPADRPDFHHRAGWLKPAAPLEKS